jgi:hypothetical protein
MDAPKSLRRRTGAERVSLSLADAGGSLPLPLASRRTLIPGLGVLLGFLVVVSMAWEQTTYWRARTVDSLFDRVIVLLKVLWVVGLWVGAVALLVLAIVLLFYRESARLAGNELIHVARVGPFRMVMEYDLAKVQNLSAVEAGPERARVRFDYNGAEHKLGRDLTPADAEARVKLIQAAIDRLGAKRASQAGTAEPPATPKPQA